MKKWKSQIFIYLNLLIRVPGIRGISTLMIGNHHKYYTTRETSCGVAHQLHHSTNNAFMSSFSSSLHSLLIIWRASVNFTSRKNGKGYSAKKLHLIWFHSCYNEPNRASMKQTNRGVVRVGGRNEKLHFRPALLVPSYPRNGDHCMTHCDPQ